jgi:hypothetical protein
MGKLLTIIHALHELPGGQMTSDCVKMSEDTWEPDAGSDLASIQTQRMLYELRG